MDADRNEQIGGGSEGSEFAYQLMGGDGIDSQAAIHGGDRIPSPAEIHGGNAGGGGLCNSAKWVGAGLGNQLHSTGRHAETTYCRAAGIEHFRKPLPALSLRVQQGVHLMDRAESCSELL